MRWIPCVAVGVVAVACVFSTGCAGGQNIFTLQRENQQLKTELAAAREEIRQAQEDCGALRGNLVEHIRALAAARIQEHIAQNLIQQASYQKQQFARYRTATRAPGTPTATERQRIQALERQIAELEEQLVKTTPSRGTPPGNYNQPLYQRRPNAPAGTNKPHGQTGAGTPNPQGKMTAQTDRMPMQDTTTVQDQQPIRKTKNMVLRQNATTGQNVNCNNNTTNTTPQKPTK